MPMLGSTQSDASATVLYLRFMVGAIVQDVDDAEEPLWAMPSIDDDDLRLRLESWGVTFADLLMRAMPDAQMMLPGPPGFWLDALSRGLVWWNQIGLEMLLAMHSEHSSADPSTILADLRWRTDAQAWQVVLANATYTSTPWLWIGLGVGSIIKGGIGT
jgi:hypothetical protein